MALTTSPIQFPTGQRDTPTVVPYRLDTTAVVVHRQITLEQLADIRRSIEPRTNFWQFAIRPWHVVVAAASYLGVVAAGIAAIAWAGAVR
jgi:hypothetical protein